MLAKTLECAKTRPAEAVRIQRQTCPNLGASPVLAAPTLGGPWLTWSYHETQTRGHMQLRANAAADTYGCEVRHFDEGSQNKAAHLTEADGFAECLAATVRTGAEGSTQTLILGLILAGCAAQP